MDEFSMDEFSMMLLRALLEDREMRELLDKEHKAEGHWQVFTLEEQQRILPKIRGWNAHERGRDGSHCNSQLAAEIAKSTTNTIDISMTLHRSLDELNVALVNLEQDRHIPVDLRRDSIVALTDMREHILTVIDALLDYQEHMLAQAKSALREEQREQSIECDENLYEDTQGEPEETEAYHAGPAIGGPGAGRPSAGC